MNIHELASLCIEVLKDWRVIVITIAMILFIELANYVVKYKKKAPRVKTKIKKITPPPEQKPEEHKEASENSEHPAPQETSGSK